MAKYRGVLASMPLRVSRLFATCYSQESGEKNSANRGE